MMVLRGVMTVWSWSSLVTPDTDEVLFFAALPVIPVIYVIAFFERAFWCMRSNRDANG